MGSSASRGSAPITAAQLYTLVVNDTHITQGSSTAISNLLVEQETQAVGGDLTAMTQAQFLGADSDTITQTSPKFVPYLEVGYAYAGWFVNSSGDLPNIRSIIKKELANYEYLEFYSDSSNNVTLVWGTSSVEQTDFYTPNLTNSSANGLKQFAVWIPDSFNS